VSVLDELRKTLGNDPHGDGWRTDDILSEIYAFEDAHPGLIDLTQACDRCNKPMSWQMEVGVRIADSNPNNFSGCLCPACAKEIK